ncbi:MAG: hypothetical protein AVDCRST_MAG88-2248, partial [uncultured Thermomicrobiales bacterium]
GRGDDPQGRGDPAQAGGRAADRPPARRAGGAPRRAAGRPAPQLDLRRLGVGRGHAGRGGARRLGPGRGHHPPARRRPPRLPAPRAGGRVARPLPGALRPHRDHGAGRRPGRRGVLRALRLPGHRPGHGPGGRPQPIAL